MTTSALSRPREDESDDGPTDGGIPHRRLILAAITVVVVGALATWLVAFSSVFGVSTVSVGGTHTVTAAEVRAAAKVVSGTPLVRLDTDAIRTRIEALPDVASATVATSFPRTVIITVSERVAIGVVRGRHGYLLVDRSGDQFRRVTRRPAHLPLFVVAQGTDARTTGGAVATVAGALARSLRARIASIQALDPNAITLLLNDGRVVRWGTSQQSPAKARILPALLRQKGDQFDVTDPQQPFAR